MSVCKCRCSSVAPLLAFAHFAGAASGEVRVSGWQRHWHSGIDVERDERDDGIEKSHWGAHVSEF